MRNDRDGRKIMIDLHLPLNGAPSEQESGIGRTRKVAELLIALC
jgi:hypothetical protein